MPPRKAPAAAKRKPVDDATLWVVEHAAAVGIDNDVLLDLLDAAKGATRSGEMPARIAQRLSLQMLSDAVEKKEPVSAKTCKLLAKLAPLESLTDDSEELEPRVRMCAEAACLARSKGWPAFKLAIDDMFPPRVNLAKLAKAARDDLLSAHKRCKSPGASEKPFNAARKKHGAHKADSAAARKDLASVVSAHAATLRRARAVETRASSFASSSGALAGETDVARGEFVVDRSNDRGVVARASFDASPRPGRVVAQALTVANGHVVLKARRARVAGVERVRDRAGGDRARGARRARRTRRRVRRDGAQERASERVQHHGESRVE